MRIVLFYHSLISDWNHGNAHFLRGIASELLARGHCVEIYEPQDSWSVQNLLREQGAAAIYAFQQAYPQLNSHSYDRATLDLDRVLAAADLVIVHEWNDAELIQRIGAHRHRHGSYRLLFHDTHHRALSDRVTMDNYALHYYDGVLAFGQVVRDLYLARAWTPRAWIWHEAADTRRFKPLPAQGEQGDLVWIGNWGDDERTERLHEFLFAPVKALGLQAQVYGVRYPAAALATLADAGIDYGGWLPNFQAPAVFAQFRMTVHIPRQPYVDALRGIPTIRVFEALACGIPLICAPWHDSEGLFTPGKDYLVVRNGTEMRDALQFLLDDPTAAQALADQGRRTVLARHTCAHRVDELLQICAELGLATAPAKAASKTGLPATQRQRNVVDPPHPKPGAAVAKPLAKAVTL